MSGLARDPMSTAARNQPETAALQQRVQQLEAQLADHNAIASRLQLQYTVAGILANAQSIELALPQVLQAIATIKEWNVALAWASVKQDLDHTAHWSAEGADTGFLATHPDLFDIHNPGSLPRRAQCSGQLIWVEDTATSTEFPVLRTASGTVLRNIVVAPLSCGQSNYGVIVLLRDFSRPFSEDFRAMYQALGNDIGRFIEATRYRVELQESHVRLSHVQRIGKIGYWEWNTETGHVFANDGAAAALQRPRKELPRTITEYLALVPEAERANVQRSLSRAIAHPNETQKFEHPLLSSAGERLTLRVHCQGRPDELGQVQRVTGSVQNVTEQRRAEKKQLANEKLWEFVFRNSPVPGVITDYTSGEFLAANDQFLRWVGMPASAIVGRTSIDIGLWHSYEERENTVKLVRTWGHLRDHEIQYVIQGELRTVLIYIEHVELGDRRCLLTKYIDITQRKKLENELNLAATAIEQAAEAIVLLDNQGRIVQANPAFTATTGYTLACGLVRPGKESCGRCAKTNPSSRN
jgi:PAS domain S-box-containing protein